MRVALPIFSVLILIAWTAFTSVLYLDLQHTQRTIQQRLHNLESSQRPLVVVNGKYPNVITTKDELLLLPGKDEGGTK